MQHLKSILQEKLVQFFLIFPRPLIKLIRDFLSERQQRVVLNGKNCDWRHISAGGLQGSVLGPLFFLVYINEPGG